MKKIIIRTLLSCALVLLLAGLIACGSSDSSTPYYKTTLSGTAAAGAPIAGKVVAVGANSEQVTAYINFYGEFTLDVTALTFPVMVYAEGNVGGQSLTIHSVAFSPGTINVTPITDFILRNALAGADPTANLATALDETAILAAQDAVKAQLVNLLTDVGLDPDAIDLLTTPFDANHTGLDQVLDIITIESDGLTNSVTVTNNLTGETYTDTLDDAIDPAALASAATEIQEGAAIRAIFTQLMLIYNTATPDTAQTAAWINTNVAAEYLEEGEDKEQMLWSWTVGNDGPDPFFKIDGFISGTYDTAGISNTDYDKAYWVDLVVEENGVPWTSKTIMVHDSVQSTWLWYGDQTWIYLDSPYAKASRQITNSGSVTTITGINLWFDDEYDYAIGNGVNSMVINGPGMPANGYVLSTSTWNPTTFSPYVMGNWGVFELSDADLTTIDTQYPDGNLPYDVYLCSDTALQLDSSVSDLSTADGIADAAGSCTVLQSYKKTLPRRPHKSTELTGVFPAFVTPSTHDIAWVNQYLASGTLNVSWTIPAGTYADWVELRAWDVGLNTEFFAESDHSSVTATSGTIDITGWPTLEQGWLYMSVFDGYMRTISTQWEFVTP